MCAWSKAVDVLLGLSELFERLLTATALEAIEALLPWNLKTILDARKRDL
jgi:hypothetical protein